MPRPEKSSKAGGICSPDLRAELRVPQGLSGVPHGLLSKAGTTQGRNGPEEILTRGPNLVWDNLVFNVSLNYFKGMGSKCTASI